jgi:general secretion pathway protein F
MFRYEAMTAAGGLVIGEMEGASSTAIIGQLQDSGYLPIDAREIDTKHVRRWLHLEFFTERRLSPRELGVATQELATLLKAGLPLDRALDMLVELSESKRLRTLFAAVLERVRDGASLADAVGAQGNTFPPIFVNMIRAGELGGALEVTLARLADYLAKAHAARESVRSALVYPMILLIVAGLSLVLVLTVVLPQFKPLFAEAGVSLPLSTRIVMAVGDAVQRLWWMAGIVMVAAILAFRHALKLPAFAMRWDGLLLRVPLVRSLLGKAATARFSRTLGTLGVNGVPLPTALALSRATLGNRVMTAAVEEVAARLKEGAGLSGPLTQCARFPRLAVQLMRVGEETGRLNEMLLNVADVYDQEVQRTTERLLALLTPALTIVLGMTIAGIIASVLVALLSVNDLAI